MVLNTLVREFFFHTNFGIKTHYMRALHITLKRHYCAFILYLNFLRSNG